MIKKFFAWLTGLPPTILKQPIHSRRSIIHHHFLGHIRLGGYPIDQGWALPLAVVLPFTKEGTTLNPPLVSSTRGENEMEGHASTIGLRLKDSYVQRKKLIQK